MLPVKEEKGQGDSPRAAIKKSLPKANRVDVQVEHGPYRGVPRVGVARDARSMLRALALSNVELSILLTNDAQVHVLNKAYRGYDKPTDVLAFPMQEGDAPFSMPSDMREPCLLGDVVISVPTAQRQAPSAGRTVRGEVTFLLAHGLLHLLGWDHDTPAKEIEMHNETARLCTFVMETSSHAEYLVESLDKK